MGKLVFPSGSTVALASGNTVQWAGLRYCYETLEICVDSLNVEMSWKCQLKENHRGMHQYTIKHDGPDETIYWKNKKSRRTKKG